MSGALFESRNPGNPSAHRLLCGSGMRLGCLGVLPGNRQGHLPWHGGWRLYRRIYLHRATFPAFEFLGFRL